MHGGQVIDTIAKCVEHLDSLINGRLVVLQSRVAAADTVIDALEKCCADHAALLVEDVHLQRVWEYVCPLEVPIGDEAAGAAATFARNPVSLAALIHRLTSAVVVSARAPEAGTLGRLLKLLRCFVTMPLAKGAQSCQWRYLYDIVLSLLRILAPLKKHTNVQSECVHLLMALIQAPGLNGSPCSSLMVNYDALQLVSLCVLVCDTKHDVALRLQNAALQLLGVICAQERCTTAIESPLGQQIFDCFYSVADELTRQFDVRQMLGEGFLLGLTGFLKTFPPSESHGAFLTLVNNIVLSALHLGTTSTNYQLCLAALHFLQYRAADALAPFTIRCANQYLAVLQKLWTHRNKGVRRESQEAAAAFWASLSTQLLLQPSTELPETSARDASASRQLQQKLEPLWQSLISPVSRQVCFALEALFHLLPTINVLQGPSALQAASIRLEEHVGTLLANVSVEKTHELFRQSAYLLPVTGQLLRLLPRLSPRHLAMAGDLLNWALLSYPDSGFGERERTVPGILLLVSALLHHPSSRDNSIPEVVSRRTIELIIDAPASGGDTQSPGESPSCEGRLRLMGQLWAELLSPSAIANAKMGAAVTVTSQEQLSIAFRRVCIDVCEHAQLDLAEVVTGETVRLEKMLMVGIGGTCPKNPEHYSAFLRFVTFYRHFCVVRRRVGSSISTSVESLCCWLTVLVDGVRAAPHASGYYTLLHYTIWCEGLCPSVAPEDCRSRGVVLGSTADTVSALLSSPPFLSVRRFLSVDCMRWVAVYKDDLLCQCAVCAVIGVALLSESPEGEEGLFADGEPPHDVDVVVRAFEVVLTATSISSPLFYEPMLHGGTDRAQFGRGGDRERLEENRQWATAVLLRKAHRSPRWAATYLPALVKVVRSVAGSAVVQSSLRKLAAQHSICAASRLQPAHNGGRTEGDSNDATPRQSLMSDPTTVPLHQVNSALHIGHLIPVVSHLSLCCEELPVCAAAAHVLCWCVEWVVSRGIATWEVDVFTSLLSVAALSGFTTREKTGGRSAERDVGAAHRRSYQLLMAVSRWYGRQERQPEVAQRLISVLLRGLGKRDAPQRCVAAEALLMYVLPPSDGAPAVSDHFMALMPRLVDLECGDGEWSRLGAAYCMRAMMRRAMEAAAVPPTDVAMSIIVGAIGCIRRSSEAPVWDVVKSATCHVLQEGLECLTRILRCRHVDGRESTAASVGGTVHEALEAAVGVLLVLAPHHLECAIALVRCSTAFWGRALVLRQFLQLPWHLHGADSSSQFVGQCAALVALLRSGILETEHGHISRLESCEKRTSCCFKRSAEVVTDESFLLILDEVIQSFCGAARVSAAEGKSVSHALLSWMLVLLDIAQLRVPTVHFAQLLMPAVVLQVVRLAGSRSAAEEDLASIKKVSYGASRVGGPVGSGIRALVPKRRVWTCISLMRFLCDVAEVARRGEHFCEIFLQAVREAEVFEWFTRRNPAGELRRAFEQCTTAHLVDSLVFAGALSQIDVTIGTSPSSLWRLVASSRNIPSVVVVRLLHVVLQNAMILNTRDGEVACTWLIILLFSEDHSKVLPDLLEELFDIATVTYQCSFCSPSFISAVLSTTEVTDMSSDTSLLTRFSGSSMTRCWQKAISVIPTANIVSTSPRLVAVVVSLVARRPQREAAFLLSLLADWVRELQKRQLTDAQKVALREVCAQIMKRETCAVTVDEAGDHCEVYLVILSVLVQLSGRAVMEDAALLGKFCVQINRTAWPSCTYSLLANVAATNKVKWGFRMFATMLAQASTTGTPVSPEALEAVGSAARTRFDEIMHNALPLRWSELGTVTERANAAELVRAGAALFTAVLPHDMRVIAPFSFILAKVPRSQQSPLVFHVREALSKLSDATQVAAFNFAIGLLRTQSTPPEVCHTIAQHLLTPTLEVATETVRMRILQQGVRGWVTEAGVTPTMNRYHMQAAAFSLLALTYELCSSKDQLEHIARAFAIVDPCHARKGLAWHVLKACNSVWQQRHISSDGTDATFAERQNYRRAAFRCLVATLTRTEQTESVFCQCLFQEHCANNWKALFAEAAPRGCPLVETTSFLRPFAAGAARREEDSSQLLQGFTEDAELWQAMEDCSIAQLFRHLVTSFPLSSVAASPPDWASQFVRVMKLPQLTAAVRRVFFKVLCMFENAFAAFVPHTFDDIAASLYATSPTSPMGDVVWELLARLVEWHRRSEKRLVAVGKCVSLQALARHFAFHVSRRDSAEDDVITKHVRYLEDLLKLLSSSAVMRPLSAADIAVLLSSPEYDQRTALEVLYVLLASCGCISSTGDEEEVENVYNLLASFLDPAAAPNLLPLAAKIVGLEAHLLYSPGRAVLLPFVRKQRQTSLLRRVTAALEGYGSDAKSLIALKVMQEEGGGHVDFVDAAIAHLHPLERYDDCKDPDKILMLHVLARANMYVASHYDDIHAQLSASLCEAGHTDVQLSVYIFLRNILSHLSLERVQRILSDFCRAEVLETFEPTGQLCVAFYDAGVAACRRLAALEVENSRSSSRVSKNTDEVIDFLIHSGLRNPSPTVQYLLLEYLAEQRHNTLSNVSGQVAFLLANELEQSEDDRDVCSNSSSTKRWWRHAAVLLLFLARHSPSLDPTSSLIELPCIVDPSNSETVFRFAAECIRESWGDVPGGTWKPLDTRAPSSGASVVAASLASTADVFSLRGELAVAMHSSQGPLKVLVEEGHLRQAGAWRDEDPSGSGPPLFKSPRRASEMLRAATDTHSGSQTNLTISQDTRRRTAVIEPLVDVAHQAPHTSASAVWGPQPIPVTSPLPSLGKHIDDMFLEVEGTLHFLLTPLQVLCLHVDSVAARVLVDLITNAAVVDTAAVAYCLSHIQKACSAPSAGGCEDTTRQHSLSVLQALRPFSDPYHAPALRETVDCSSLTTATHTALIQEEVPPTQRSSSVTIADTADFGLQDVEKRKT